MADVVDMRDEGDTIPNFLKLDQIPKIGRASCRERV